MNSPFATTTHRHGDGILTPELGVVELAEANAKSREHLVLRGAERRPVRDRHQRLDSPVGVLQVTAHLVQVKQMSLDQLQMLGHNRTPASRAILKIGLSSPGALASKST
jgi:hypothetical protein